MKKALAVSFLFILLLQFSQAQKISLDYYLPALSYKTNVPTPEAFLGYQVGEWHVSHDQLVMYMRELARVSDRITIEEYARSYENRPLYLLTITSPENHQNLEQIREDHIALSDPSKSRSTEVDNQLSVIYQGFSIHGNEPSGSNAALLVAYYLAAAEGAEIEAQLQNTVILLDPSFNPDGLHRFSTWANMHKNKNITSDPNDREYDESWPRGRTNHYWFDLNRDWLLVQHPESRGRIKNFHKWKPNILTDHHEMGTS
ncbi:MAG: M14 family zinc carboxypeptidase, partial [Bacteroidota bacterium]